MTPGVQGMPGKFRGNEYAKCPSGHDCVIVSSDPKVAIDGTSSFMRPDGVLMQAGSYVLADSVQLTAWKEGEGSGISYEGKDFVQSDVKVLRGRAFNCRLCGCFYWYSDDSKSASLLSPTQFAVTYIAMSSNLYTTPVGIVLGHLQCLAMSGIRMLNDVCRLSEKGEDVT